MKRHNSYILANGISHIKEGMSSNDSRLALQELRREMEKEFDIDNISLQDFFSAFYNDYTREVLANTIKGHKELFTEGKNVLKGAEHEKD